MTDPIADMITRIKNAGRADISVITLPHSRFKEEIATVLHKGGYLTSVAKKGKRIKKYLELGIAYTQAGETSPREPKIIDVKRISKPSRRVYQGVGDMHPVRGDYGVLILSTPKGVMIDREAKRQKVGGEVLFKLFA